jgi:hypothetical protein
MLEGDFEVHEDYRGLLILVGNCSDEAGFAR